MSGAGNQRGAEVSVVMAAYNCEAYVGLAMDSLLQQTSPVSEIVVADDGSSDDTRAILDAYEDSRIKRFHNSQNVGYLKTCNKLLSNCRGQYILFQDADDWSEPSRVEVLRARLDADPELHAVGSAIHKVDAAGHRLHTRQFPLTYEAAYRAIRSRGKAACVGTLMFRRELLDTVGVYRDFFDRRCFEDVDWLYRVMDSYRFENCPEALYNYRNNPESVTREFDAQKILMREVVHLLGTQRASGRGDLLDEDRAEDLEAMLPTIEAQLREGNPLYFDIKRINRSLINRNSAEFRLALRAMLTDNPFRLSAYGVVLVSFAKFLLGLERYYHLRDRLLAVLGAGRTG